MINWHLSRPDFEYQKKFKDIDLVSAWVGHKTFAYDLVSNFKPKLIVELGTHKGASFFAMCQAVKDHNLDTLLVAIDTWTGDKHSGLYKNSIYREVKNVIAKIYPNIKTELIKDYFDNALNFFKPKTIDLLHIDGLHTYDAVKHDFDNWIDKLSPNGIILMHDITEKSKDFGVYKFWDEIKDKYHYYQFQHSHGLGIIFLGKKPEINLDLQETWKNYYEQISNNLNFEKIKKLEKEIISLKKDIVNRKKIYKQISNSKFFRCWQKYNYIKKLIFKK